MTTRVKQQQLDLCTSPVLRRGVWAMEQEHCQRQAFQALHHPPSRVPFTAMRDPWPPVRKPKPRALPCVCCGDYIATQPNTNKNVTAKNVTEPISVHGRKPMLPLSGEAGGHTLGLPPGGVHMAEHARTWGTGAVRRAGRNGFGLREGASPNLHSACPAAAAGQGWRKRPIAPRFHPAA